MQFCCLSCVLLGDILGNCSRFVDEKAIILEHWDTIKWLDFEMFGLGEVTVTELESHLLKRHVLLDKDHSNTLVAGRVGVAIKLDGHCCCEVD